MRQKKKKEEDWKRSFCYVIQYHPQFSIFFFSFLYLWLPGTTKTYQKSIKTNFFPIISHMYISLIIFTTFLSFLFRQVKCLSDLNSNCFFLRWCCLFQIFFNVFIIITILFLFEYGDISIICPSLGIYIYITINIILDPPP